MNKKAAMEMSVGTIVTIVLLVTVLVLGLTLIRTIFKTSVENVEGIDQEIKDQINKLFAEDNTVKISVFPQSRKISIRKGNEDPLGFGFSIRNVENSDGVFRYTVTVDDPNLRTRCNVNEREAQSYITLGDEGNVNIGRGQQMDDPIFVRFRIPETAPPCEVRYAINVKKDGQTYGSTVHVDLFIKAK